MKNVPKIIQEIGKNNILVDNKNYISQSKFIAYYVVKHLIFKEKAIFSDFIPLYWVHYLIPFPRSFSGTFSLLTHLY